MTDSGNPAAERLRDRLLTQDAAFGDTAHIRVQELDAALLHERRATVERIAARISELWPGASNSVALTELRDILDATSEEEPSEQDIERGWLEEQARIDATIGDEGSPATEAGRILEKTLDHHPEYCAANGDQGCDCPLLPGILAIEAESERVSLDVERLARARHLLVHEPATTAVLRRLREKGRTNVPPLPDACEDCRANVAPLAAEYARLSPSTGTPEAGVSGVVEESHTGPDGERVIDRFTLHDVSLGGTPETSRVCASHEVVDCPLC